MNRFICPLCDISYIGSEYHTFSEDECVVCGSSNLMVFRLENFRARAYMYPYVGDDVASAFPRVVRRLAPHAPSPVHLQSKLYRYWGMFGRGSWVRHHIKWAMEEAGNYWNPRPGPSKGWTRFDPEYKELEYGVEAKICPYCGEDGFIGGTHKLAHPMAQRLHEMIDVFGGHTSRVVLHGSKLSSHWSWYKKSQCQECLKWIWSDWSGWEPSADRYYYMQTDSIQELL